VNGSRRLNVITEKKIIGASNTRLILAGWMFCDRSNIYPDNRHNIVKMEKEIPGTFFQKRISNEIPSRSEAINKYFLIFTILLFIVFF
jgi:hypothetical protein